MLAAPNIFLLFAQALSSLIHQNIVRYYYAWAETPPPGWQERQDNDVALRLSSSANHEEYYDTESKTTSSTSFDSRQLNDRFKALYVHSNSSSLQCAYKVENDSGDYDEIITESELDLLSSTSISSDIYTYHYILMELCREESLAKWLENRDPELDIYKMYREILKAVRYLHEKVRSILRNLLLLLPIHIY